MAKVKGRFGGGSIPMSEQATHDEAAVRIACVQMEPIVGEKDRNVRRSVEMIEEAAGKSATRVVLRELCRYYQGKNLILIPTYLWLLPEQSSPMLNLFAHAPHSEQVCR